MSEGCSDIYGQFLSVHLALSSDCGPGTRFPQMFKYTFPHYILIREIENKKDLYQALLLGSGFWLEDKSRGNTTLRPAIARAIKLRLQLNDYFAYGRYEDTDNVAVTDPSIAYSSFVGKDGRAVVFLNPRRKRSVRCSVRVSEAVSRASETGLDLRKRAKPVTKEETMCSFIRFYSW